MGPEAFPLKKRKFFDPVEAAIMEHLKLKSEPDEDMLYGLPLIYQALFLIFNTSSVLPEG